MTKPHYLNVRLSKELHRAMVGAARVHAAGRGSVSERVRDAISLAILE